MIFEVTFLVQIPNLSLSSPHHSAIWSTHKTASTIHTTHAHDDSSRSHGLPLLLRLAFSHHSHLSACPPMLCSCSTMHVSSPQPYQQEKPTRVIAVPSHSLTPRDDCLAAGRWLARAMPPGLRHRARHAPASSGALAASSTPSYRAAPSPETWRHRGVSIGGARGGKGGRITGW